MLDRVFSDRYEDLKEEKQYYGHSRNLYCPDYDPTPRPYWDPDNEMQETILVNDTSLCDVDSDCKEGHYCLL